MKMFALFFKTNHIQQFEVCFKALSVLSTEKNSMRRNSCKIN